MKLLGRLAQDGFCAFALADVEGDGLNGWLALVYEGRDRDLDRHDTAIQPHITIFDRIQPLFAALQTLDAITRGGLRVRVDDVGDRFANQIVGVGGT